MHRFLAPALLLLQVAASTSGLPYLLRQAQGTDTSVIGPNTISSSPDSQHPATAQVDEDGLPNTGEPNLSRELADLSALQLQLVELQREVQTRQKWLAEFAGLDTAKAGSKSTADCDGGVACLVRTILRKTRYAAAAVFDPSRRPDGYDDLLGVADHSASQTLAIKIPLPPWRRPRNGTSSEAEQIPQETLTPDGDGSGDDSTDLILGLDLATLALPFAVFTLALISAGLFRRFQVDVGYRIVDSASLPLWANGGHDRSAGPREGRFRRLRRVCNRVLGAGGFVRRWGGERWTGVRLGAEAAGSHEYVEEKRAGQNEHVGHFDERDAPLLEDRGDEDVERQDETESVGDSDSEHEELLTLGEELASFRAALEMVEGIVAAEEGRARGRER